MKRILLVIACITMTFVSAWSQINMSVSSQAVLMPSDADAISYYRQVDVNDQVCAIIKVVPDYALSGRLVMQTKGGMTTVTPPRGESNYREGSGEWWFWVSPKVTNIMFTCDGYTATDWIGVSLQSGKVYRLNLNVDSSVTILQNFTGTGLSGVKMTITPKDATVYYGTGGSYSLGSQTITDGFFDLFLDKGKYNFKVESEYYNSWSGEIEILDDTKEVTVNLQPAFGLIALDSNPQGARVLLDGKPFGVTPIQSSDKISSGKHVLRLEKENYYAWEGSVAIEPTGRLQRLQTVKLTKQFGTATILCDDKDATLIISDPSGKEVARGKSGMKVDLNSLYTYKLEATKSGHASQSRGISGKALEGKEEIISIGAPAPMYGGLALSSTPSRADVYIDGKFVGTTAFGGQILVGKHKVELKKEDYAPEAFEIEIQHNQTLQISKGLKEAVVLYEWVDLGLPSGLKWATCNLGASKPEEFGDYYAWGETKPMDNYTGSTYKWLNGDKNKLTKYCTTNHADYWDGAGPPDGKTDLDPEDDAAFVRLGEGRRMPTGGEWTELMTMCSWTWTNENGVDGYKVTGTNGNSIFLPAAGFRLSTSLHGTGSIGRYWSSSLDTGDPDRARDVLFGSGHYSRGYSNRCHGFPVRPVLDSPSKPLIKPKMVDLGLSVKWADCNLGASKPEEYGGYYAWGETETKSNYIWSTYKWCNGDYNKMTKYCPTNMINFWDGEDQPDGKCVIDSADDVARVKLGGSWRMPTDAEWSELIDNCTWNWTTENGVNGLRVTGPNGNRIFLPAAGGRNGTNLYSVGSRGYYWSSSLYTGYPDYAWYVYFNSDDVGRSDYDRCDGQSVRPVSE